VGRPDVSLPPLPHHGDRTRLIDDQIVGSSITHDPAPS
jgi:hypothetical protein